MLARQIRSRFVGEHGALASAKMIALALAAQAALGATGAAAAPEDRTAVVSYGDLNLATKAGADRLHRRIGGAVVRVCGSSHGMGYEQVADWSRCARQARAAAAAKMDRTLMLARGQGQQTAAAEITGLAF